MLNWKLFSCLWSLHTFMNDMPIKSSRHTYVIDRLEKISSRKGSRHFCVFCPAKSETSVPAAAWHLPGGTRSCAALGQKYLVQVPLIPAAKDIYAGKRQCRRCPWHLYAGARTCVPNTEVYPVLLDMFSGYHMAFAFNKILCQALAGKHIQDASG